MKCWLNRFAAPDILGSGKLRGNRINIDNAAKDNKTREKERHGLKVGGKAKQQDWVERRHGRKFGLNSFNGLDEKRDRALYKVL